ncbi:hypothetical protein AVEN_223098-1 [Araneus ventricosus]|uniref:Uncharacterized protein n=1 Tax=Araneus ventricosus TaxID=182803 RepID=A0A4Y2RE64_ARAVE|nr:hypothetical protein AVEN_223098-1 [Araneus ventricosus]
MRGSFGEAIPAGFSTHSSKKICHVHSSEVPKCAGSRGEQSSFPSTAALRSPYSIPHSVDFRFATLAAGCRSSQAFDVPTSLAKGLSKNWRTNGRISDCLKIRQFSTLSIVFSFSCSKISILDLR